MRNLKAFLRASEGSFAPIFAITIVPLITAVGLAVDYSSAVSDRSTMQNALDVATLSLTTMPKDASQSERQNQLQSAYEANGGLGTASMVDPVFDADGTLHLSTSASYAMPTTFMHIASIDTVPVGIATKVTKKPSLIEATFKINMASGWWDKTITLYGRKFNEKTYSKLMKITYDYNGFGDPKGYGTTTIYTVDGTDRRGRDRTTQAQQQVCTTKTVSSFWNASPDDIQQSRDGKKYLTSCTTTTSAGGTGASIDLKDMEDVYLQMDVPDGDPDVLKTNDPATSDRLFIGDKQVQQGKTVDIFSAVPCGGTSTQAWEDGGTKPSDMTPGDADFSYDVSGKCDYTQRVARTQITQ
jgi:Flp pilus assembly protein TadG